MLTDHTLNMIRWYSLITINLLKNLHMKTTLLCAAFAVITSLCQGQPSNLPKFEKFSNGIPPGWTLVAATIKEYNRNGPNATCISDTGVATNPSAGSSGGNKTGIETDTLRYVSSGSVVTVSFKSYAYRGNQFDCNDQLYNNVCSAYGQVLIYDVNGRTLIGMSDTIPLNLTITGTNTINAVVTGIIPANTAFIALLDISYINCSTNGSKRIVIDDIFISATAGGPLPVIFKSFSAMRTKQTVALNWTTATEQNSRGFNVQRNVNGIWETIAFVNSRAVNGNSNTDLTYSYMDVNNLKDITQYRIVQVDLFTGRQQISEVRSIKGEANGKTVVFPNPSSEGKTNLLFDDQAGTRSVSLIDPSGRVVRQWVNITSSSMQLTELKPGFYYLKINNTTNGEQSVERLIVK